MPELPLQCLHDRPVCVQVLSTGLALEEAPMGELTVWCYLKNIEQSVALCHEEGCHDPEFMAQCLGQKPADAYTPPGCACEHHAHGVQPCGASSERRMLFSGKPVWGCDDCIFQHL